MILDCLKFCTMKKSEESRKTPPMLQASGGVLIPGYLLYFRDFGGSSLNFSPLHTLVTTFKETLVQNAIFFFNIHYVSAQRGGLMSEKLANPKLFQSTNFVHKFDQA